MSNSRSSYTYGQHVKQKIRHLSLYKAVEILTTKREQACCVERNYVRRVYDYYISSEDISNNKVEAEKIDASYITNWEKLHDSFVGTKRPENLSVCYLSGPEPQNDFLELINLGIMPQNIWAFEMDKATYDCAVSVFRSKGYPQPRILKQKIEDFFRQTPKKFDIVYIDACGTIPSKQHALKCIISLFLYHRLNSPGVIISNFAMPDLNCSNINDYYENIAQYLFFKENASETLEIENEVIKNINYKNFLEEIKNNFNKYYGEYISAILRDIPSFIIPSIRIAQNTYINQLIDLEKVKRMDNDFFINLSDGNSIAKYFFCMTKIFNNLKGSIKFESLKNEISDFDNLLYGLKVILLLREGRVSLRGDIEEIKNFFETKGNIYQFLDKPHSNLFFDIIINQIAYPMHSNVCQNTRFEYVAKTNHMFTDITVYDECRYIYEWLPGLHQMVAAFKDLSWQYIFRFALDGLVKMRQNYNNEFFYQGSVVSKNIEEFASKKTSTRKFFQ